MKPVVVDPLVGHESPPRRTRTVGKAERDCFDHALHQHVQRLGLRVTAAQFRNIGYEVAFFILLDDDSERIRTLRNRVKTT
jgi:hypothetical protein